MAKFATDMTLGAIGAIPTGWSKRWDALDSPAKTNFTIQDVSAGGTPGGSIGGKVLRVDVQTTNFRSALSADVLDGIADVDIKARVRVTQSSNNFGVGLVVRGAEDSSGFDGYFVSINEAAASNHLALAEIVDGTAATIQQVSVGGGLDLNKWYWLRFQVSGTALRCRIWADGVAEPGTWNIDTTDASISSGGFVGIYSRNADGEVDWFSAGTGGDTPPDSGSGDLLQFTVT